MNALEIIKSFGFNGQIIGTDVSLETCINEGYLMVQMDGDFRPDWAYNILQFLPDYCMEENGTTEHQLILDTSYILTELIARYTIKKQQIDEFIGGEHSLNVEDYDYHAFLHLADDINSYWGL